MSLDNSESLFFWASFKLDLLSLWTFLFDEMICFNIFVWNNVLDDCNDNMEH